MGQSEASIKIIIAKKKKKNIEKGNMMAKA